MYKIVIATIFSVAAITGCTTQETSSPAPTVTITEQAPRPEANNEVSNTQKYISFVKENGGYYAAIAGDQTLINLGNIVCDGYADGLSQEDIVNALSYALVENNMDNQDGAVFAASLIVGAERYLCGVGV